MLRNGMLTLQDLDQPYVCVIQLTTQPPNVLHQVTIRPDKVKKQGPQAIADIVRLGETQGDEAVGWVYPNMVNIVAILGRAIPPKDEKGQWSCEPIRHLEAV